MMAATAYVAIQCNPSTGGPRGAFLYTGNLVPTSPVFPEGLTYLSPWLKANGWTPALDYDPQHPCGVYNKS